jgi:type II secretory pathway component PulM
MKPAELTAWYSRQSPRDQRILRIGAVGVVLIALLGIFLPLQRGLLQARARVQQQQQDLEWMKRMAPTLAAAGPGTPVAPANGESLVVLIDRSAREAGLVKALTASQPAGNGAMRVQFTGADFNLLLGWLHRLSTQQGLHIEDASITASGTPGIVNASLQLRPGK